MSEVILHCQIQRNLFLPRFHYQPIFLDYFEEEKKDYVAVVDYVGELVKK